MKTLCHFAKRRMYFLLLIILPSAAQDGGRLPVWYSAGPVTQADLESEYHKPLQTFDRQPLRMVKKPSEVVDQIRTCREYLAAVKEGFQAQSNYEHKHELLFVDTCYNVNYLKQARPAAVSYFPDQGLPTNLLGVLPLIFHDVGAEADEKKTWREQDPRLILLTADPKRVQLEDEEYHYDIQVKVAGDLNGDGIEDLAGYACLNAKEGTEIECKPLAITRCGSEAPIKVISSSSAPFAIAASSQCLNEQR